MTKRFAFTLAEVLIALAIIGVVAAMTIPTFMANTAGAQFKTGLKKATTILTQAASANYATEGYDFSGTNGAYAATATNATPPSNYETNGVEEEKRIIGFNTETETTENTLLDRHPETSSLFHLFQKNLNMKNSSELVNYAIMPVDIGLNCKSVESTSISVSGSSISTATSVASGPVTRSDVTGRSDTMQVGGGIAELCDGRSLDNGGFNQGYMFQLEDDMVVTYDPAQAYCTESNPCFVYVDVNGPAGPNRVISCSPSSNEFSNNNAWIPSFGRNADPGNLLADCTVEAKDITDIYPLLIYGSSVKPGSRAAKSVLYSKKSNQTSAPSGT